MKELIVKREKNTLATKEEFLADMEILFEELKNSYGGYEYFGEERFALAKDKIVEQIETDYTLEKAVSILREEPDAPMDFLQKNSDTFLAVLKEEYGEEMVEPGIETYKSEGKMIRTGQMIYALIDRFVCSSGESAIANLKTIEGTVVVGENSAGCYFSGNCINIYLSNTGICVYYGTGRVLYNGTQNIDELGGFTPDIYGEFEVEDIVAMAKETMEK